MKYSFYIEILTERVFPFMFLEMENELTRFSQSTSVFEKYTDKSWYSCNKINKLWIQISRQNWNGFYSNINYHKMIN